MVITSLTRFDAAFFVWLCGLRRGGYPWLSRQVSRSADGPLYALIGALLILIDHESGATTVIVCLIAFAFELPVYAVLKHAIRRDRPQVSIEGTRTWLEPSDEFSFPSGHTAAAFLMACVLAGAHPALTPWLFAWAILVGASRVNLGVHYPGDVLAGALLGAGSSFLATRLVALPLP